MNFLSLPDYISGLIASGTYGAYISLAVLAFALLSTVIGLFSGMLRGFGKQTVRLLTIAASAVISFLVAASLSGFVSGLFEGKTLEEVIISVYPAYESAADATLRDIISSFDAKTAELLLLLPISTVVVPLIFVVLFAVLNLVLNLVSWILSSILGLTGYKKGFFSTILGGVIGALQGVLVAAVILMPVAGFASMANNVKTTVESENDLPSHTVAQVDEFYAFWLDDLTGNPLLNAINTYGGDMAYAHFAKVNFEGEDVDMRDEAENITHIVIDASVLYGMDWQNPAPYAQYRIRSILADVDDDPYLAEVISGLMRGLAKTAHSDALPIPLEEPYISIVYSLLDVFIYGSGETISDDLETLVNVYFILGDSGFISALSSSDSETITNLLVEDYNGDTVINTVITELKDNGRTKSVVDALTKLSVAILCQSIGITDDATEVYENVKDGINTVLSLNESDYETPEEYKSAVSTTLDETLKEHDIELEEEIIDEMSNFIVENFSDVDEITDEDINDAILYYYDAYAKTLESSDSGLPETAPVD